MHRPIACLLAAALFLAAVCTCPAAAGKKHEFEGYTVHVIFSNHLDVGFTDLDSKVIDLNFHQHLPHAVQLAREVETSPNNTHDDTFRYLSHSWLLSLFLDCPPAMGWTCPNDTEVDAVRRAIQDGTITWHAAPFNPQYEVFDSSLLRFAVELTHKLDDTFQLPHKRMASLRDVPGMTRAAIPVLASQGVTALSSGVNGFSAPPGVPKTTPFIWLDEATSSQLIYMVHPGGYAGVRSDGLHIDSHKDCVKAPGLKHVMCASWGDDNLGPPKDADTVLAMFHHVRRQWPGARVVGSTLEAYLDGLTAAVEAGEVTLPVFTGEVGDTWIHGIASDPGRMADYRAVLRARRECEQDTQCDWQSPAYFNFSRLLLKVPEHTWGVSFNQYFGDFTNYTNAWLRNHLSEGEDAHPGLAMSVESWRRQRRYIDWALEALPPHHPVVKSVSADRSARQQLASIDPHSLTAAGARTLLHLQQHTVQQAATIPPPHTGASAAAAAAAGGGGGPSPAAGTNTPRVQPAVGGEDSRSQLEGGYSCAALVARSGHTRGVEKSDLLFCSKHWLIHIDKRTGGLTRVQRIYGEGEGAQLGNDWARGRSHTACSQQQQQQQQQQHTAEQADDQQAAAAAAAATAAAAAEAASGVAPTWVQRLTNWLLPYVRPLAAWLPSPDAAAAAADFAVGDEAQHAGEVALLLPEPTAAAAAATSRAGSADEAASTAVFRRKLLTSAAPQLHTPLISSSSSRGSAPQHHQQHSTWGDDAQLDPAASASAAADDDGVDAVDASGGDRGCSTCCQAGCRSAFAELQYNVYNLADYDPVWEHYAYIYPVWIGDFGKNNLSASSNMSHEAKPHLAQVYDSSSDETGLQLALELHFSHKLVKHAGAPARAWLTLTSPPDSDQLQVTLVWQNKTATRLPEALWLRFKPGKGAVDDGSWRLHKLDGVINPADLVLNGSHSLHAISSGVSVSSRRGDERLSITSWDVPLVNVGEPNPLPNPCVGPDMTQGVAFNPVNNIWGTNYAMWVPFIPSDATMAFRFVLEATHTG